MTISRLNIASALIFALLLYGGNCVARTIELTDADSDQMAVIGPQAPRSGWLMNEMGAGEFTTTLLDLRAERSFLIRYPLDRVPPGQRITRAEWILPVGLVNPTGELRLYVRRIVGDWGAGVCHLYRMLRPKKVAWTVPGAAGVSTDRAAQPTAIVRISGPGEQTVNVTEDVELWYTGAAENHGWILTVEDPDVLIRFGSPLWDGKGTLKLRIIYEPE